MTHTHINTHAKGKKKHEKILRIINVSSPSSMCYKIFKVKKPEANNIFPTSEPCVICNRSGSLVTFNCCPPPVRPLSTPLLHWKGSFKYTVYITGILVAILVVVFAIHIEKRRLYISNTQIVDIKPRLIVINKIVAR